MRLGLLGYMKIKLARVLSAGRQPGVQSASFAM